MLNRFLEGGGSSQDIYTQRYHHTLFQLRQDLDNALIRIGRMSNLDKNAHMSQHNLTYHDICSHAQQEWKMLADSNWAPTKTKPDSKVPPAKFGANMA